jgi:hypothetical protein
MSKWMSQYGKVPKIANIYPKGSGIGSGGGGIGLPGRMMGGGMGGGIPRLDLRGGLR